MEIDWYSAHNIVHIASACTYIYSVHVHVHYLCMHMYMYIVHVFDTSSEDLRTEIHRYIIYKQGARFARPLLYPNRLSSITIVYVHHEL